MNKIKNFINTLHAIWITDALMMDEFMDVAWTLMLRQGVNWKQVRELDNDNFIRAIEKNSDAEEMFEYDVNDKSKDVYENFEHVCLSYMDFSMMMEERRVA
jgi:uncharacterized glyoxalase superfamily metalloenzyme YdcJ